MAVNESSSPDLESSTDAATCVGCKALDDVIKYCVTCREDCCMTCSQTSHEHHDILPRGHSIVKNIKLFSSAMCTSHKDEKLSMYCITCKTPCCVSCIDDDHDGHPLSTMKSIAKQAESMYVKLVDVLPQAISEYKSVNTEYENYVQSMDSTLHEIKGQFERLRMTFDEVEASMLEPLVKEVEDVKRMHSDHGQILVEAECLVHLYQSVQEDSPMQKVVIFSNCPTFESLKKFKNVSFPELVSFKPAQVNVPNIEETIGCLNISCDKQCRDILQTSDEEDTKVPHFKVLSLKSIDNLSLESRVFPEYTGDKWMISDSILIRPENSKSKLVTFFSILNKDLQRKVVESRKDIAMHEAFDAAIIPHFELVYTIADEKQVWRVSKSGLKRLVVDTSPVTPSGICYTSRRQLAIGLKDPGKNGRSLIRTYYLKNLRSIQEIEKDEQGKPLFSYIKSITENTNKELIVYDEDNLLCISRQRCLRWKIKHDFKHFCIDRFCSIVVAADDEIRVLDSNGIYIKTLLTKFDFLTKPTSLFIDHDGLMWIGQGRSTKVVKYWK